MDSLSARARFAAGRRSAALTVLVLMACMLIFGATAARAQEEPPAEEATESAEPRDSTAIDRAEDRYRASRELQEADRSRTPRRPNFTVPRASPDGFDRLPPESKQHLRDQLRDVIIEEGEWQPEDAGKPYPYVPSDGAMTDTALKQAEREAWGEMVADYHAREAEAHAARQAASGGQSGGEGEADAGENGEAGDAGASAAASAASAGAAAQQSDRLSAEELARQADEEEVLSEGVTQSALDYLRGGSGRPLPPAEATAQAADVSAGNAPGTPATGTAAQSQPLPGLILIEDLPKARGIGSRPDPDLDADEDDPDDPASEAPPPPS